MALTRREVLERVRLLVTYGNIKFLSLFFRSERKHRSRKKMILTALLVLPSVILASSSASAQLYLSPVSSSSSHSIALSSHQVNSVLAHHLSVSAYEPLPVSNGGQEWEETLTTGGWGEADKLVILLECSSSGCNGNPSCRSRAGSWLTSTIAQTTSHPHSMVSSHSHCLRCPCTRGPPF